MRETNKGALFCHLFSSSLTHSHVRSLSLSVLCFFVLSLSRFPSLFRESSRRRISTRRGSCSPLWDCLLCCTLVVFSSFILASPSDEERTSLSQTTDPSFSSSTFLFSLSTLRSSLPPFSIAPGAPFRSPFFPFSLLLITSVLDISCAVCFPLLLVHLLSSPLSFLSSLSSTLSHTLSFLLPRRSPSFFLFLACIPRLAQRISFSYLLLQH